MREFLKFLWDNKFWWIIPIVGVFLFLVIFILLTEQASLLPFWYANF